jgi:hypothetical protein
MIDIACVRVVLRYHSSERSSQFLLRVSARRGHVVRVVGQG